MKTTEDFYIYMLEVIEGAIARPGMYLITTKDQKEITRQLVNMFDTLICNYCFLSNPLNHDAEGYWNSRINIHKFWAFYNKIIKCVGNRASCKFESEDYETRIRNIKEYVEIFKEWRDTVKQYEGKDEEIMTNKDQNGKSFN